MKGDIKYFLVKNSFNNFYLYIISGELITTYEGRRPTLNYKVDYIFSVTKLSDTLTDLKKHFPCTEYYYTHFNNKNYCVKLDEIDTVRIREAYFDNRSCHKTICSKEIYLECEYLFELYGGKSSL
jgi:hypothetical protein